VRDFFNDLPVRAGWGINDAIDFPRYRDKMLVHGYSLDDLNDGNITKERWADWGFKEGHLGRLRTSAQAFKIRQSLISR
jgi:hypothetical protein